MPPPFSLHIKGSPPPAISLKVSALTKPRETGGMGRGGAFISSMVMTVVMAGLFMPLPARAADAITLTLGGRIREFFFVASEAQAPAESLNSTGMFNDTRISVDGRTVLDNGITVRAFVRFNAVGRQTSDLDEAYVDVISTFGRLRMGEKAGLNTTTIGDPVPEAFLTVDDELIGDALKPRTGITLRDGFTFKRFTENALGISYQTPEVYGFKIGVAYHPTTTTAIGTVDAHLIAHDALDATAGYEGDFTGGTYRLAGGYFHLASRIGGNDGVEAWNLSAGATYGGFELAAAYINTQPANGLDENAWTVGALYGIGPLQVSADYRSARRRPVALAILPAGVFREHVDRATLQTAYKLAPGITVGVAGFYADQSDAAGVNWDSGGVLSGIKIEF
jgi:predicted porin